VTPLSSTVGLFFVPIVAPPFPSGGAAQEATRADPLSGSARL